MPRLVDSTIVDAYIGCTICAKNCPVMAIGGAVKSKHTIRKKRCIDCSVCGRISNHGGCYLSGGYLVLMKAVAVKERTHP